MKESTVQAKMPESAPAQAVSQPQSTFSARHTVHPILQLQRAVGNQTVQRLIQRKCACGGETGVDGECEECRKKRLALQREAVSHDGSATVPAIVRDAMRSPGQPLDSSARGLMEIQFGRDFSQVRVHTDAGAAASAEALNANAYTSGRDIYFAAGKYAPENDDGKRLLAHELVHTIQQRSNTLSFARKTASTSNLIVDPDDSLEQDAVRVANQVVLSASLEKICPEPIAQKVAPVAQAKAGGSAVQRKIVEGTTPVAQTSLAAPEQQTPISIQTGGTTVPNVAPPSTEAATPAPSGPYPPFHWGHFAPRGEPVAVARTGATLWGIAEFLYGTPVAALDLASINQLELSKPLGAGTVVQLTGEPLTETAARNLASASLLPASCGDPDLFVAKKKLLDVLLQVDFNSIVAWVDEKLPFAVAGFSRGSGPLPDIFRKWGEEKFTEYPWAYPSGGDYLDRLFLKLYNKTKILSGIFTDEWTNYYSLIFNHFDPDDEVAAIRDRNSVAFRSDSGIPELSFASMFWEDVKSGKVRDRIFAGAKGMVKGAWSGLKGTVKFAYTVITDPGQAWEDVKKLPGAVKSLWEHRSELWNRFANASPEEQAEMIGNLFGQIEFIIASYGVGSLASKVLAELSQLPGMVGRVAKVIDVILKVPSKVLGGALKVAKTIVFKGVEFAAEGAMWAAKGILRLGEKILRGTWSVVEETVGAVTKKLYYFYDETAKVLRQIDEGIASWFVKCKSPCNLTKEAKDLARQQALKEAEAAGKIERLPPGPMPSTTAEAAEELLVGATGESMTGPDLVLRDLLAVKGTITHGQVYQVLKAVTAKLKLSGVFTEKMWAELEAVLGAEVPWRRGKGPDILVAANKRITALDITRQAGEAGHIARLEAQMQRLAERLKPLGWSVTKEVIEREWVGRTAKQVVEEMFPLLQKLAGGG
jgi:Domain of unknown function (DUF4157)